MIGSFFRHLEEQGVRWLLVSGQATIGRVPTLRKADPHFWRSVIDELRQLRSQGKLMPEGAPV